MGHGDPDGAAAPFPDPSRVHAPASGPATWSGPTAPPRPPTPRPPGATLGVGQALATIGSIVVIVSIFLNWVDSTTAVGTRTATATTVPVQFLFDYQTRAHDPSIVLILVVGAALGLFGTILARRGPALRLLAAIGGLLAVGTAFGYGFRIHQYLHASRLDSQTDVIHLVGFGPWFAAAGGLAVMVGAVLSPP
jgi:hypothetical protein